MFSFLLDQQCLEMVCIENKHNACYSSMIWINVKCYNVIEKWKKMKLVVVLVEVFVLVEVINGYLNQDKHPKSPTTTTICFEKYIIITIYQLSLSHTHLLTYCLSLTYFLINSLSLSHTFQQTFFPSHTLTFLSRYLSIDWVSFLTVRWFCVAMRFDT